MVVYINVFSEPDFGEAVYSKINVCYRIEDMFSRLMPLECHAKTTKLQGYYVEAKAALPEFQAVYQASRKKAETELSNNMKDKLKAKYQQFDGRVKDGRADDNTTVNGYGDTLNDNLENISDIFSAKGKFIGKLETAMAKIKALRTALNLDPIISSIDTLIADYKTNFVKKVDKKVEESGTCAESLAIMREIYGKFLGYMEFCYKDKDGSANEFIESFNTICTEYSASVKTTATAKAKANAKKATATAKTTKK